MEVFYPVMLNGKQAGKVSVRRQGLYYHFSCSCRFSGEHMYRLIVSRAAAKENLGILVPSEGSFTLQKKLPVKRIGEGDMSFHLASVQDSASTAFIPICPEEPFAYLERLKEAYLERRYGQIGARIHLK